MNIISLFDGISCGQVALERAGIQVDNYYASEIDKKAIFIANSNYPLTKQLGNITTIMGSNNLTDIDLLLAGSPCQGFSKAGKGLNFKDERSKLFFEFLNVLELCKPKFYVLENVPMKIEYQDIISGYLGVQPITLNSANFSKQTRKRLYWTNIPVDINHIPCIDNTQMLNKWLYRLGHGYVTDEIKFYSKYPTLVAQSPATKYRIIIDIDSAREATIEDLRRNNTITRSATPEECEEFQTLPYGYTEGISKTSRYKVIGNGWNIETIKFILNYLH